MAATKITEYTDYTDSIFLPQGSPTFVDDQYCEGNAPDLNGSTQYLKTSGEFPIRTSSGNKHTVRIVAKVDTSEMLIAQTSTAGSYTNAVFVLKTTSAPTERLYALWFSNGLSAYVESQVLADLGATINDGNYHVFVHTINGNVGQWYLDGVAQSTTNAIKAGTGFTDGVRSSGIASLTLGATDDATQLFNGIIGRSKIVEGEAWTQQQVTDDYDELVAKIGICDFDAPTGGPIGGLGRPNFRLDGLRQPRWNRGPVRFKR